jgi:TonB family protein
LFQDFNIVWPALLDRARIVFDCREVNDPAMISPSMLTFVWKLRQRKDRRVLVTSAVRFSVYVSVAILSQIAELVAAGGGLMTNSALDWPKSFEYDTPPKLISGNYPVYPVSHARAGSSGFADVTFTVGRDGKTYDIQVLRTSYSYFGSHTVLAVRDWKFEPARKNGKPVPVKTHVLMPFNGWRWPISKKWLKNQTRSGRQD